MKQKNVPLVTIIVPVKNGLPFLAKALKSIEEQTYRPIEVFIIDDGSTDKTVQLVNQYKRRFSFIHLYHTNRTDTSNGISLAMNIGIKHARGQFIARMDADDIMEPNRIKEQVVYLQQHPSVVALGSWTKEIDVDDNVIGERRLPTTHGEICEMFYYAMGIQNPTVMFNRSLLPHNFSWYNPNVVVEDLDLYFRIMPYGTFANIPHFLLRYRIREGSYSLGNIKKTARQAALVRAIAIKKYGYKPTVKAAMLHIISTTAALLLPKTVLLKFYKKLRTIQRW